MMTERYEEDVQKQDRKKVLFINCCITVHEESRTEKLARAFLGAYLKKHPGAEIEERNLMRLGLKPLDPDTVRKRNALSDAYAGKAAQEMTDGGLFLGNASPLIKSVGRVLHGPEESHYIHLL